MKNRFQKTPILLAAVSFTFLCLSQSSWSQATRRTGASQSKDFVMEPPHAGNTQRSRRRGYELPGEWKVKCEVKTYQGGRLQSSSQDKDESIVVAEQTADASYYIHRFPLGFGEAFPSLLRISPNEYAGQDTVRGIDYFVKQSVGIEGEKISIKQTVTHAPTKQVLTEIVCTGNRLISDVSAPPTTQVSDDACSSDTTSAAVVPDKIARRYESAKPFSDGLAAVALTPRGGQNRKWGFIDETGRVVVPIEYDVVTPFHDGFAKVGRFLGHDRNIKWGLVEKLGPQVTSHLNYDDVKILGDGFAAVGYAVPGQPGLKWNLINRENTLILHGFDSFECFVGGRARAAHTDRNGLHRGYINNVGDFFESK